MRMSLKGNQEYIISGQWLKPYLQILSARQLSQLIKTALGSIRRFLLAGGELTQKVFTERILNELILVLINCKFDEIDLHDTYNTSILILKTLEAVFAQKSATQLRQDTLLALLDYLEDDSQLEGVHELVKIIISTIIKALFSASDMYLPENESQNRVLLEIFRHLCNTVEHLCASRETLKNSADFKLKLRSVDTLNFNLSLIYRVLKYANGYLNEESPIISVICKKLCPVLHQVFFL